MFVESVRRGQKATKPSVRSLVSTSSRQLTATGDISGHPGGRRWPPCIVVVSSSSRICGVATHVWGHVRGGGGGRLRRLDRLRRVVLCRHFLARHGGLRGLAARLLRGRRRWRAR